LGEGFAEYRVAEYPAILTPDYVSMMEEIFSARRGVVIIRLEGGGSDPLGPLRGGEVGIEEYIGLIRRLRTVLSNAVYSDAIYVSVVSDDLWGFPIDILLASDHVYGGGYLASRGYSHLISGFTYGFFRGGQALLNLLGMGVDLDRLVEMGMLSSVDPAGAYDAYEALLTRKRVLREVFLRDYHHLLEMEETVIRRYVSSI